jgi:hypothetical protein
VVGGNFNTADLVPPKENKKIKVFMHIKEGKLDGLIDT